MEQLIVNNWIASFLYGRSQQVFYKGHLSAKLQLLFGVPRVCFGPILFLLYTAELLDIVVECGLMVDAYADDTQVYVTTQASDQGTAMGRLTSCIVMIRDWMASNCLKLNEDKTQVIWLGTRQQLSKLTENRLTLLNATVQFSTVVNNLGVLIDSQLSMSNHIAALSRSCFFHVRQLRLIRQSLTPEAMNTLVQDFITTRLDSCNSVLVGVSNQLLQRMQVIQNAAARFITGARRFEHMTPVLRNLHWLPIWHRIKF